MQSLARKHLFIYLVMVILLHKTYNKNKIVPVNYNFVAICTNCIKNIPIYYLNSLLINCSRNLIAGDDEIEMRHCFTMYILD